MTERPILFSGPLVRAILEGRKTQTRRPIKPQPPHSCRYEINGARSAALCLSGPPEALVFVPPLPNSENHSLPCPFGAPGDRLWVRETFTAGTMSGGRPWVRYAADKPSDLPEGARWKPSIHMPRWASRLTLEVTDVRVQRLQDISEADACAEGFEPAPDECDHERFDCLTAGCRAGREGFREAWDAIYGETAPWASNAWVWAVSFKVVEVKR